MGDVAILECVLRRTLQTESSNRDTEHKQIILLSIHHTYLCYVDFLRLCKRKLEVYCKICLKIIKKAIVCYIVTYSRKHINRTTTVADKLKLSHKSRRNQGLQKKNIRVAEWAGKKRLPVGLCFNVPL